ncbi:hypothetical protein [Halobacillus yeomjeoni]|uniref:Uncharacterized protein n=1 Tax=Halobacillus yeomjeoni TaxID=311194 RepID=A0A931MVT7_9BACI|nr:hypothetical protein [Halobacillus yeomjeoni]MBH0230982.1 hypothetical protein [Halobacillus yeomjeoni]
MIERLQALERRLAGHSKQEWITQEIGKMRAGIRGESSLDYHLHFIKEDYYKLNSIRLLGLLFSNGLFIDE